IHAVARESKSIKADLRNADALRRRLREAAFLLLLPLVVYLFACLATYNPQDCGWSHAGCGITRNIGGTVGAWSADLAFHLFGWLAYAFPLLVFIICWNLLPHQPNQRQPPLH